MNHRTVKEFWYHYHRLPLEIQNLADKNHELLKIDSKHKSLRLKMIGQYWSVRIGLHYRALGVQDGDDIVWFWIGSHADYDDLI